MQSIRSMELVIDITGKSSGARKDRELSLRWSARLSLTSRILAVNILAVAILAGSLFYLDNYRSSLIEERLNQARLQVSLIADALEQAPENARRQMIQKFANELSARIRIYESKGEKALDSFQIGSPTYTLIDPNSQPWRKDVARALDRMIENMVRSRPIAPFVEPETDIAAYWQENGLLTKEAGASSTVRFAPERTPMIIASTRIASTGERMMLTSNARDITRIVRAERSDVVLVIFIAIAVSTLLSLFLARTIVRPIAQLARAAIRVRWGREPEITVPRMPERRDEIGQLARALSDMSGALRERIDATEAFAADVSHEIKNPLASLRSALDGLGNIKDPKLQNQLLIVAQDDVRRIDRLINDISDASRLDAELARTKFERVDIGRMLDDILAVREQRDSGQDITIAYARPGRGAATVMGDDGRLERVFTNIIDNAVSFSPKGGLIEISATPDGDVIIINIADQGPGVPKEQRQNIFNRFHSDRPDGEEFGKHSGLGLAIAKAIIEAHEGSITVHDKPDGTCGAFFKISLPAADSRII